MISTARRAPILGLTFGLLAIAGGDAWRSQGKAAEYTVPDLQPAKPAERATGAPVPVPPFDENDRTFAACREILIQFEGAVACPPTISRSREEAQRVADEVYRKAAEEGIDFDELVSLYDEGFNKDRHGFVGVFPKGTRPLSFEEAVFPLDLGEVAGPIETPFGFHVVFREKGETYVAAQILIRYQGAVGAERLSVSRSRVEAIQLIASIRERVVADPESFATLARTHTEGPKKQMGGNIGQFNIYTYGRYFGEITGALSIDEISDVFETRQGFNILKRIR